MPMSLLCAPYAVLAAVPGPSANSQNNLERRSRRLALSIASCLLAILSPITAAALEPDLDFKIVDEASYQSFKAAISKTEYVRNAYIQDPKPRVIGAVAGLVHYATFNPLASDAQLATFLTDYDAKLAVHALGDADLQRGSHLVSAVRFELPLSGVLALDGTNTNLGEEIAEFLGIDVPPAYSFEGNERRIVRFEQARLRALSESPEWANLLVIGFSGQDLLGGPNPNLAGVLQTYLEGEGYSPFAPICGGCTDIVGNALAALPVSFTAYQQALDDPFAPNGIVDDITDGYAVINQESLDRVTELTIIMTNEPSLVEAAANANNAAFVAQRQAAYLANLAKVADERTIINVNAMILAQSPDDTTQNFGRKAQRFASIQISQNNGWAAASEGIQIAGGFATLAADFAGDKDPVNMVGGAVDIITGALGLGSLFGGGEEDDAAEQKIFDELTAMRGQLDAVQFQLNGRFNRVETQINVVYDALIVGFDALGLEFDHLSTQIEDTIVQLDGLERQMMQSSASLDRIEDALWAIGVDMFDTTQALIVNGVLNYRASGGDLSFQDTNPNFVSGTLELFTFATTTAVSDTYAGSDPSTLTIASAGSELAGSTIGRQVNDLRVFPTHLGLPEIPTGQFPPRVPAPSLWAQSASAYAQVARESPWYFARMYQTQVTASGTPSIHRIIEVGESLDTLASNTRDQALFDALFDAWRTELEPVTSMVNALAFGTPAIVGSNPISTLQVAISGDLVISGGISNSDLYLLDISTPTVPIVVGSIDVPGFRDDSVAIIGDLAFVAANDGGLQVVDISDPTTPFIVGSLDTGDLVQTCASDVEVSGLLALVVDCKSGLLVIDISDPTTPVIVGIVDAPGIENSVELSGNHAFVSTYDFGTPANAGLYTVDISAPSAPIIVGSVSVGSAAGLRAISGDLAIVGNSNIDLKFIDISDPTSPSIIGSIDPPGNVTSVVARGDLAFVATHQITNAAGGLQVIDFSDPVTPVIVGSIFTGNSTLYDIAISGNRAYVVDGYSLQAIELSDSLDWQDVLDELQTNAPLISAQTNLLGFQKLIESYITLGMPELMEESTIARAALRSDATVGELSIGPVDDIVSGYISNLEVSFTPWSQVSANLQLLQDEVNVAIANPSVGHGYVDYMLAELEHLKDNASRLAFDDAYYTPSGVMLSVPVGSGLLANDVDQEYRVIQAELLVDAPNGLLDLHDDGSFDYTPDPGFGATDTFTYRAFTSVSGVLPPVYSEPATVKVTVGTTVTNTDDDGVGSLRAAIANAPAGDVIRFAVTLDGQTIQLASRLDLTQNVTIDASTLPNRVTIDGGGTTQVLHIASGVVASIEGVTITGGNASGIENAGGTLSLVDVSLIANSTPGYGAGIINLGGTLTMTNTTIANNVAGLGGGGIYNGQSASAVVTLINSTVYGNTGGGGGIRNYLGEVNLIHTTIVGNESTTHSGGGIHNGGGLLSFENSIVAQNTAAPGSIDIYSNTNVVTIGQNLIGDNTTVATEFQIGPFAGTTLEPVLPMLGPLADNGGPTQTMLPQFGSPAIDSATDEALTPATDQRGQPRPDLLNDIGAVEVPALYGFITTAADDGSEGSLRAILAAAPPGYEVPFDAASLNGQPIVLNGALGPLYLIQDVTISGAGLPGGLTIDGNNATRVFEINGGATVSLEMLTITGGATPGNGAGIYNLGTTTLDLVDVALVGNDAGGLGGGVMNLGGTVTMTNTTVANNNADLGGGGLFSGSSAAAVVTLVNSTVYGNTGGGAGIGNYQGAVMSLIHTTVVGNDSTANPGGGIWNGGGTLNIENSIVAQNTAVLGSPDIYSDTTVLTAGQNLIGDNESVAGAFPEGPFAGTTLIPVPPGLGALADNGGPTQTMLPMPGSPAIDSALLGTIASPTTDQRGEARPGEPNNDIGSVEVPEPSSLLMLGVGCVALAGVSSRRRKHARKLCPLF